MALPDGPATVSGVRGLLQLTDPARDQQAIADIVAAANAFVRALPVAAPVTDAAVEWPAPLRIGATMLAARLYRRRNSPTGVETFGAEGTAYVSRNDPDVAQMLQLGPWAPPVVG